VIRHHQRRHRTAATPIRAQFDRVSPHRQTVDEAKEGPFRRPESKGRGDFPAIDGDPDVVQRQLPGNRDFDERLSPLTTSARDDTVRIANSRGSADATSAVSTAKAHSAKDAGFRLIISSPGVDGSVTLERNSSQCAPRRTPLARSPR